LISFRFYGPSLLFLGKEALSFFGIYGDPEAVRNGIFMYFSCPVYLFPGGCGLSPDDLLPLSIFEIVVSAGVRTLPILMKNRWRMTGIRGKIHYRPSIMVKYNNMQSKMMMSIALILSIASCSLLNDAESKTTDRWSRDIRKKEEKIEFARRYIRMPSEILDTEFHIVYHDNSTGMMPGPSDWNIVAVFKVRPENLDRWRQGMMEIDGTEMDLNDWNGVLPDTHAWKASSVPEFYRRENEPVYMAIYRKEGIVLKSMNSR
jgi:hypothetical protein